MGAERRGDDCGIEGGREGGDVEAGCGGVVESHVGNYM